MELHPLLRVFVLYFSISAYVFLKQNVGTLIIVTVREYYLIPLNNLFKYFTLNTKCRCEFLKKHGVFVDLHISYKFNAMIFISS